MNFLAHAALVRAGSDDFLYGNLIADGIKGPDLSGWREEVAAGVQHHRRVDAFVDAHPAVLAARRRAPQAQRRYAAIALDILWDHFLLQELEEKERDFLIQRCYRVLEQEQAPARLEQMIPVLIREDWLHRYSERDFTYRAIAGIGSRLSGPNRLAELVPHLRQDHPRLAEDFQELWMDVRQALEVSRAATGYSR